MMDSPTDSTSLLQHRIDHVGLAIDLTTCLRLSRCTTRSANSCRMRLSFKPLGANDKGREFCTRQIFHASDEPHGRITHRLDGDIGQANESAGRRSDVERPLCRLRPADDPRCGVERSLATSRETCHWGGHIETDRAVWRSIGRRLEPHHRRLRVRSKRADANGQPAGRKEA